MTTPQAIPFIQLLQSIDAKLSNILMTTTAFDDLIILRFVIIAQYLGQL